MDVRVIFHARFERLGAIGDWLDARQCRVISASPHRGDDLAVLGDMQATDMLIVMGGPQSPRQIDQYPYLRAEIEYIGRALTRGAQVLGICLGAQLIAESLGAATEASPHREVGVFPIALTAAGQQDRLFQPYPARFDVAHWHEDMPGLPAGSEVLAHSAGCPRQVVRFSERAYGLQCHMELRSEDMARLVKYCPEDVVAGEFVQTSEELLAYDYSAINQRLFSLLDKFILNAI